LTQLAKPLQVTFHRAIDVSRDAVEAFNVIQSIPGIDRVLTSGHAKTVLEGIHVIKELVAGAKIKVCLGGGITATTLPFILHHIRPQELKEIHMTGMKSVPSVMKYRNNGVYMGGVLRPPEYEVSVPDASKIINVQTILHHR
jgi:copper homeostasis protein